MEEQEHSSEEATKRRLASRELGKAKRSIAAIRNFYVANAILWGVPFLISLLAGVTVLAVILGAGFLFMVAGVVLVRRQPFVWSLLIASIWTLYVVSHLVRGGSIMSMGFILAVLWTLGCWIMLPTTVRVNKLLAEYPDLRVSKQMRGGRAGKRR